MIDKIVELIIERSKNTVGQNVAARFHTVLMEVHQAVAKVIAEEQKKEREQNKPVPNTCAGNNLLDTPKGERFAVRPSQFRGR